MNNIKQTKKAREYSTASEGQQDSYMDQMCDLTTNVMWSPSCVSTLCVWLAKRELFMPRELVTRVNYLNQLVTSENFNCAYWHHDFWLVVASVMSALLCILS